MAACDHCVYRNSWDCGDGWNRHNNCREFKLDFDSLTDRQKRTIQRILEEESED